LFNLPAIFERIIGQWVDMQIRLHQLPAEQLLRAVTTAGIEATAITSEGQLARLRTIVERTVATGDAPHSSENRRAPDDRRITRQSSIPTLCRSATINLKLNPCQRLSRRTSSLAAVSNPHLDRRALSSRLSRNIAHRRNGWRAVDASVA
jgi:hypothetical protein